MSVPRRHQRLGFDAQRSGFTTGASELAKSSTSAGFTPSASAIARIVRGASQRLKCHSRAGQKAFGVPSRCQPGRYYLVLLHNLSTTARKPPHEAALKFRILVTPARFELAASTFGG